MIFIFFVLAWVCFLVVKPGLDEIHVSVFFLCRSNIFINALVVEMLAIFFFFSFMVTFKCEILFFLLLKLYFIT